MQLQTEVQRGSSYVEEVKHASHNFRFQHLSTVMKFSCCAGNKAGSNSGADYLTGEDE